MISRFRYKHGHKAAQFFLSRNNVLRAFGFSSYHDYLKSPLWHGIRKRVLDKNRSCCKCGNVAFLVFHGRYDEQTIQGHDTTHLYPVCGKCMGQIDKAIANNRLSHDEIVYNLKHGHPPPS